MVKVIFNQGDFKALDIYLDHVDGGDCYTIQIRSDYINHWN